MGKPVIFLQEKLKPNQIDQIKAAAPDYQVIDAANQDSPFEEKDIAVMLGWNRTLGERLLSQQDSHLQWVQAVSAGVDSLDLKSFSDKKILLSNGSGIHSISIAEHVLGILLSEYRGLRNAALAQEKRKWSHTESTYQQLSGQSMLIVGTGHIGKQLAAFAQGLGIRTYGINSTGHPTSGFLECYAQKNMSRIIKDMDIVVNILPLTDQTYYLYNADMFQQMKDQTVFINVGRGPSVQTEELIDALHQGKISFAALDVFEEEPLPENHPLWTMDNVLITPHISGITPKFKDKLTKIFLTNLEAFISTGKLKINQINLEQGY